MTRERRIRLPNIVKSANTTFSCHVPDGLVDIGPLADLSAPTDCISQLSVDHFFVTFSAVSSNFNGVEYVDYNEVIIKVPVVVADRPFVFPPRTYVDNELSLVRGYQLGFNKYMTAVAGAVEGRVAFDGKGLQIEGEVRPDEPMEQSAALAAAAGGFILSDGGVAMELVVSDHTQSADSGWLGAGGGGVIAGRHFDVKAARRTADRFVLHHATAL
ncbi:hypothetical protein ABS642_11400 [Microbacterium sp. A8/3-1]|uniref:Uncharacterized protein n=1 Tax=Microbacterium sp. A8/3-1 TaxID=3160749 RepID=A0AAU7VQN4_9MICO